MICAHSPTRTDVVPERTIRGRLLTAVRLIWCLLALLSVGFFALCMSSLLTRPVSAVQSAGDFMLLVDLGLPRSFDVIYFAAFDAIQALTFFVGAVFIFWRRSDDWMAVLTSMALLTFWVAITPAADHLALVYPEWKLPFLLILGLGLALMLVVFYLFPDGRYVPRWTRPLAFIWVGWTFAWILTSTIQLSLDPRHMHPALRFLVFLISFDTKAVGVMYSYVRMASFALIFLGWFSTGVFAQIYRYTRVSSPIQRQQTKWVVFGLTAAVLGYFTLQLIPALLPMFGVRYSYLLYSMISRPFSVLFLLLVPLSFSISVSHYRLWDIDPLINRTLVYGTITGLLAGFYFFFILLFQYIFRVVTGQQSTVAVAISTLVIASLFRPIRDRMRVFIDRRFYREKVDFRRAFTNFSREVRTIIDLPQLLRVLVNRTTDLLHITHGAVFLYDGQGEFKLAAARDMELDPDTALPLEKGVVHRLRAGLAVTRDCACSATFPLLVPLIALQTGEGPDEAAKPVLVGVLGLGPRLSGQNYSREDQALLTSLADQAGTAIYVARLVQERQDESRRREEAERYLEAHRNSPVGRAEIFAQMLLSQPELALIELHRVAQSAGQDPDAASLISQLPRALGGATSGPLDDIAEGFNYLFTSQFEPEMLPVGLRILIAQLERTLPDEMEGALEALRIYKLCQAAWDANSVAQITQLLPDFQEQAQWEFAVFEGLLHALSELRTVAEALHAYERLDTSRDKLTYLASAVERIRRVDRLATTELSGVDRVLVWRIAESWLAVVTGAMSDLQARAQITCQLLTRHTWQGDVIALALNLRNEGRGAAINLRVTLAPATEYTLLDPMAQIERLAPGEEMRVELRVRPRLGQGVDEFRARFVVLYTDPRGPDQVENFADVVHLLSAEGEFRFIPNPYVVGTPLQTGSPLFFGREDVVTFIRENLAASHRNNMVLIGQRRTGKTSLLKQLPARLGDEYLPVYLDGQTLGLDPGMSNFFLTLATEIAFALQDRGFEIEPPDAAELADSPAVFFEYQFLPEVRKAIEERHLLIMFDEFEELEAAVRRGNLEPSIFGFLRHLIQHSGRLSVIFCGTHRLEELAADYWNVLFNISLYRHVGYLEQEEAFHLIQEPVATYGMRYDDLALDKIWHVTAGHPYFLQLLCHSLVNRHNRTQRTYVTVADVNAALDEILASGEAHFVYLWTESTPQERLALTVLSRMMPLIGQATPLQVVDYLAERGVTSDRRAVSAALHHLTLRGILRAGQDGDPGLGEAYHWQLGLLGLWVEKYRSMSRVVDEVT